MSRLLIQSTVTGRFLVPSPEDGQPCWVARLDQAAGGVVDDLENAVQLIEDHTDFDEFPVVVDLNKLLEI